MNYGLGSEQELSCELSLKENSFIRCLGYISSGDLCVERRYLLRHPAGCCRHTVLAHPTRFCREIGDLAGGTHIAHGSNLSGGSFCHSIWGSSSNFILFATGNHSRLLSRRDTWLLRHSRRTVSGHKQETRRQVSWRSNIADRGHHHSSLLVEYPVWVKHSPDLGNLYCQGVPSGKSGKRLTKCVSHLIIYILRQVLRFNPTMDSHREDVIW